MSTIQKLDPGVRVRRKQRADLLRFFKARRDPNTEVGKFCIAGWAHMVALREDSGSDGIRKHWLAMNVYASFDQKFGSGAA